MDVEGGQWRRRGSTGEWTYTLCGCDGGIDGRYCPLPEGCTRKKQNRNVSFIIPSIFFHIHNPPPCHPLHSKRSAVESAGDRRPSYVGCHGNTDSHYPMQSIATERIPNQYGSSSHRGPGANGVVRPLSGTMLRTAATMHCRGTGNQSGGCGMRYTYGSELCCCGLSLRWMQPTWSLCSSSSNIHISFIMR